MKEELLLEEVPANEWLERIFNGESGVQSGNCAMIYNEEMVKKIGDVLQIDDPGDPFTKWIRRLDDGYRTFYILRKKDWYGN